jgi:hypothetical protein
MTAKQIYGVFAPDGALYTCLTDGNGNLLTLASGALGNPTAKVGLTAVNGTSALGIRSDGAPALDQSISPTWTGTHTFTNSLVNLLGSSTGYTTFASANSSASNYTITFPAATGTVALTSNLPVGANPTATIGLSAVNGSAATFMRSDAAPALASTTVSAGSYGSATQVGTFTVNAAGQLTAASNTTVTPAASSITGGQALTRTNDTNVTITLGGTPSTALLAAASLTVGWTGTLAAGRLNNNVVQGVTNDTNVTGSISAQNLTLGWTGNLSVARGGTGLGTLTAHAVLLGEGTSNVAFATIGTAGNLLIDQGAGADPAFTAMSGDATISGAGALTLATVNAGSGSVGSSTAIPVLTTNAKGLVTAQTTAAVIAPAGTLTGTTLAANVVTSSLTTVGTIGTGTWHGSVIGATYGGTGINNGSNTLTLAGVLSLPAVAQGDLWYGSAANTISALAKSTGTSNFLKNSGTSNNPAWAQPATTDLSDIGTFSLNTSGTIKTTNATNSSSTSTGALVATGGLGVGAKAYINGPLSITAGPGIVMDSTAGSIIFGAWSGNTYAGVYFSNTNEAGIVMDGNFNAWIAGAKPPGTGPSGSANVFIGDGIGSTVTSGGINVGIGYLTLNALTTGTYNWCAGYNTAPVLTTGTYNLAAGANALQHLTTGSYNLAIGASALAASVTDSYSVAIGTNALTASNIGSTTTGNTAVGYQAGLAVTTGTNNTLIGYYGGGVGLTTGSNNTIVGGGASITLTNPSGAVILTDGSSNIAFDYNYTTASRCTIIAGLTVHDSVLLHTNVALSNSAGANTATLTNSPATGNPTKWIAIDDNGTTRHIPAW